MGERLRHGMASAAVIVGLAVVIGLGWRDRERFSAVGAASMAPAFALPDLDGDTVTLEAFRGKVVLLNFWATWCPPCVWEMPSMERVYQELAPRGFEVVAVSFDPAPRLVDGVGRVGPDVRGFVEELGLTFTVLWDPRGDELQRTYNVLGLPTTFLIDRDGRITEKVIGPAEWDRDPHRAMILELLES